MESTTLGTCSLHDAWPLAMDAKPRAGCWGARSGCLAADTPAAPAVAQGLKSTKHCRQYCTTLYFKKKLQESIFKVSKYFNFCHGSHRRGLRGLERVRRLMQLEQTLTEQPPNAESGLIAKGLVLEQRS